MSQKIYAEPITATSSRIFLGETPIGTVRFTGNAYEARDPKGNVATFATMAEAADWLVVKPAIESNGTRYDLIEVD